MRKKVVARGAFVIGLLCLTGVLFHMASDAVRYKTRAYADVVNEYFDQSDGSYDVLFLGTSKIYRSISPMDIWEKTGVSSYVVGTPSQRFAASYYLACQAIRTEHPKVIVVGTYGMSYDQYDTENDALQFYHQALDGLPFGRTRLNMIVNLIPELAGSFDEGFELAVPFFAYHSRFKSLKQNDFIPANAELKGHGVSFAAESIEWQENPEGETDLDEGAKSYLAKLIEICKKTDTRLVLMREPSGVDARSQELALRQNQALRLAQEEGVDTLDFFEIREEIGLDPDVDMMDPKHCNRFGSVKVSEYVGTYLKETFDLPDHSDDAEWALEYEQFEAYIESAAENTDDNSSDDE